MSKLTLEQFKDRFDGSPIELLEFAHCVNVHLDPDQPGVTDIIEWADKFVDAEIEFENAMEALGIELG